MGQPRRLCPGPTRCPRGYLCSLGAPAVSYMFCAGRRGPKTCRAIHELCSHESKNSGTRTLCSYNGKCFKGVSPGRIPSFPTPLDFKIRPPLPCGRHRMSEKHTFVLARSRGLRHGCGSWVAEILRACPKVVGPLEHTIFRLKKCFFAGKGQFSQSIKDFGMILYRLFFSE